MNTREKIAILLKEATENTTAQSVFVSGDTNLRWKAKEFGIMHEYFVCAKENDTNKWRIFIDGSRFYEVDDQQLENFISLNLPTAIDNVAARRMHEFFIPDYACMKPDSMCVDKKISLLYGKLLARLANGKNTDHDVGYTSDNAIAWLSANNKEVEICLDKLSNGKWYVRGASINNSSSEITSVQLSQFIKKNLPIPSSQGEVANFIRWLFPNEENANAPNPTTSNPHMKTLLSILVKNDMKIIVLKLVSIAGLAKAVGQKETLMLDGNSLSWNDTNGQNIRLCIVPNDNGLWHLTVNNISEFANDEDLYPKLIRHHPPLTTKNNLDMAAIIAPTVVKEITPDKLTHILDEALTIHFFDTIFQTTEDMCYAIKILLNDIVTFRKAAGIGICDDSLQQLVDFHNTNTK